VPGTGRRAIVWIRADGGQGSVALLEAVERREVTERTFQPIMQFDGIYS
jgi:hypothetical protein